ncbi:MAG: transposase [Candidatus Kariarchaeaceae archaeon]
MNLVGKIIEYFWEEIDSKYSHIKRGQFIVMPNHLHGIIIIDDHCSRRGAVTAPPPTLGKIIAWYKYQSTKHVNIFRQSPGAKLWQRNYYDRIIRNEKDYNRILKYIQNNPTVWEADKDNPKNL